MTKQIDPFLPEFTDGKGNKVEEGIFFGTLNTSAKTSKVTDDTREVGYGALDEEDFRFMENRAQQKQSCLDKSKAFIDKNLTAIKVSVAVLIMLAIVGGMLVAADMRIGLDKLPDWMKQMTITQGVEYIVLPIVGGVILVTLLFHAEKIGGALSSLVKKGKEEEKTKNKDRTEEKQTDQEQQVDKQHKVCGGCSGCKKTPTPENEQQN